MSVWGPGAEGGASGRAGSPARRAWPAVRALLIAGVLFVEWIDAMPLPELNEKDLSYEVAQDELEQWRDTLAGLGVELTSDELAQAGLRVGAASTGFRRGILRPFRPVFRVTGIGQAWGLFAYPDPYAGRLTIEGRGVQRAGTGRPWYFGRSGGQRGSPEPEDLVEYRRVRGIYDDNGDRPRPGSSCTTGSPTWVAWEIFTARPEIEAGPASRLPHLMRIVPPGEGEAVPDDPDGHAAARAGPGQPHRAAQQAVVASDGRCCAGGWQLWDRREDPPTGRLALVRILLALVDRR